jgi:hypothetical protein
VKASHTIFASAVYDLEAARLALDLKKGCLPREIRLGRLRASKRGGKVFILGAALLAWLQDGEVRRQEKCGLALAADAGLSK